MSKESSSTSSGIGFGSLLTIAFIVLKLCKVIAWSWWWVLAPIWMPLSLVVAFGLLWLLWYALYKVPDERKRIKTGMNPYAWKRRKKLINKGWTNPEPLSKWDERIEQFRRNKKQ